MLKRNLLNFTIVPTHDPKQALRIRRFFMAFAAYIAFLALFYISYYAGFMEWTAVAGLLVVVPVINIFLYLFFRTGLNLKMADPSLTAIQICAAIVLVMYVMYFTHESVGVLLLVYVIILMFGIYKLNTKDFIYISIFTLFTYGIDIALRQIYRPHGINFHLEYVQWVLFALFLAVFSVISGSISSLRRKLSISKAKQAKYIEILQEMAIRDVLTGLHNRRHVLELLNHERNLSARGGGIFCIGILDIDHFKNVNDVHGHQAGDTVLTAIATTMKNALRNTELCGRYGGEEFLIIMTQTDIKGALVCAERVRTQIEKSSFPEIGPDFKITVSIGVSEHRIGEDIYKTIARADEALYRAKEGGRNRVEMACYAAAAAANQPQHNP